MDIERRRVLRGTGTAGMLAAALAAGILKPSALLAAWNQRAFDAKSLADKAEIQNRNHLTFFPWESPPFAF